MSTSFLLEKDVARSLRELVQRLRVDSVRCSAATSSGHPTSSMSAADLMAVLLARPCATTSPTGPRRATIT